MANNREKEFSEDDLTDLFCELGKEDAKTALISTRRMKEFQFACGVVEKILARPNMKISYKLHKPFKSTCSITIEGDELLFTQAEWFSRVAEFADVTELCPLADGRIRLSFGFNGMTKPIE